MPVSASAEQYKERSSRSTLEGWRRRMSLVQHSTKSRKDSEAPCPALPAGLFLKPVWHESDPFPREKPPNLRKQRITIALILKSGDEDPRTSCTGMEPRALAGRKNLDMELYLPKPVSRQWHKSLDHSRWL